MPPSTAFNIAWSLKLEFICYLMFPVMLAAVSSRKNILTFYAFFLMVRLWVYYMTTPDMWALSYSTVFGGGTIFLTGMLTASLPPVRNIRAARFYLASGIILFCAIAVFIWKSGGYQQPRELAFTGSSC